MLCASLWLASTVQYLQHSLLLLVTSASDSPLYIIKFCSVLFVAPVNACCHKQDSLMRYGLCDKWMSTFCARNYSMIETVDECQPLIPKPDIQKITIFAPVGGPHWNYTVWYKKTGTVWLPGGEKILKI